jgi:hypothetical protein
MRRDAKKPNLDAETAAARYRLLIEEVSIDNDRVLLYYHRSNEDVPNTFENHIHLLWNKFNILNDGLMNTVHQNTFIYNPIGTLNSSSFQVSVYKMHLIWPFLPVAFASVTFGPSLAIPFFVEGPMNLAQLGISILLIVAIMLSTGVSLFWYRRVNTRVRRAVNALQIIQEYVDYLRTKEIISQVEFTQSKVKFEQVERRAVNLRVISDEH